MGFETNIGNHIRLDLAKDTVLFRNNQGFAKFTDPKTKKTYPVRFGVGPAKGGGSDHIGWTEVIITPDMVGKKIAVFTAVEVKTLEGDATDLQIKFVNNVRKAGGYAGFANSKIQGREIIKK